LPFRNRCRLVQIIDPVFDQNSKECCRNALAHGPAFERRLRRKTFRVALGNEQAFPRYNERSGQSFGRLERGVHGSFELFGVDLCRQRLLRQHVAHRPQLRRGIRQSALDVDGLEIHGALADRKRNATLAPKIFGRPGHSIRKRDVDRLVGAIDDRLAELRALCVGRREKPNCTSSNQRPDKFMQDRSSRPFGTP
jgi:hypothetical protein